MPFPFPALQLFGPSAPSGRAVTETLPCGEPCCSAAVARAEALDGGWICVVPPAGGEMWACSEEHTFGAWLTWIGEEDAAGRRLLLDQMRREE